MRYYRIKGCRSNYKSHAQKLSADLGEFFKIPFIKPVIKREVSFSNGLRSDAVILLIQQDKGLCIILEVCNTEMDSYFQSKVNELRRNRELILSELTQLLGYPIQHFILAVEGKRIEGVWELSKLIQILREVV
jgi:hypothetical protein